MNDGSKAPSRRSTGQDFSHPKHNLRLEAQGFADLFGTSLETLPLSSRTMIDQGDFRYQLLEGLERDAVLLEVFKKVDSGELTTAGKEGKPRWEKGWSENLESFRQHGRDLSKLQPKYIRPRQPVRLFQNYVLPVDSNFELNWYEVFQNWLFTTYFRDVPTVYEFGCGSGINLAALAKLYPEKHYFGLDWASASKEIVGEVGRSYGWKMEGHVFDFFEPDNNFEIEDGSIVFTLGALEQTGRNYEAFLQYLLRWSPALCINIEPIIEWYDEEKLVDYAAIRFHKVRRYWEGFPQRLQELEQAGRIEIVKMKRSYFGSLFLEGYSQLIWRPVRQK